MADRATTNSGDPSTRLLYHFCRLQAPMVFLPEPKYRAHLERAFALFQAKGKVPDSDWSSYQESLYPLDCYIAAACLEGIHTAWEFLFSARAGRSDCLLIDALRARAVRLYPRDEERQDSAVTEFWSNLLVPSRPDAPPILARYDGQRPLVPWLIRVFQNWHISQLRHRRDAQALPDEEVSLPMPATAEGRWHEAFCLAARESLRELSEQELLILGLRLRYRMSQREVATLLGLHEGTISRQTDQLRDRCLERIGQRLLSEGWAGDDLSEFVQTEMGSLLLDEPRLSADHLAEILNARGKQLPVSVEC